jgi:tol-pal system protein YbgF
MRIKNHWLALITLLFVSVALPVQAQRLSLAERVDKLEQQAHGNPQGNIELVNQINALQAQVQQLQGQVEELHHQVDELKNRSKDQYIDLDSRIGKLEGRAPGAAPAAAPGNANNGQMQDIELGKPAAANAPPAAQMPPPAAGGPGAANLPPPSAPPASAEDPKAAYDAAFSALKDGRYAESARRFQSFIEQHPNDDLTPNAYYWLGESYYVTQNYPISQDTFRKLLTQYPNSQKAPDALLKIGYCQYEQKQWSQAEATLNQVVQQYPNTMVANLAQGRLRALKLEAQH